MTLVYYIDTLIATLTGLASKKKGNPYLQGNFSPIDQETFDINLNVEGALPPALDGLFARVGPNPHFNPLGDYHWFDGDGMVHACRIKNSKVSYCNRYVRTARWNKENQVGHSLYLKFGDMVGLPGMMVMMWNILKKRWGWLPAKDGEGTGNTALVFHAGRLLALHEGDLPYQVRVLCDGIIETAGRLTLEGNWKMPFTAHPKVDPITGDLVFFGYKIDAKPHCVTGLADKDGKIVKQVEVDIPQGVMMHDIAITQDYLIVLDLPLVFKPESMVKERDLPIQFDPSRAARFGILRRDATDDSAIQWFETEALMIFHVANAWQEGDLVHMFAPTFEEFSLNLSNSHASPTDKSKPRIFKYTFDLASGKCTRTLHAHVTGDFPQVPADKIGLPCRYAYLAVLDRDINTPAFTGIAKIDLTATDPDHAVVGQVEYGSNQYGGEAYFVPNIPRKAEDDGFLITYVHNETSGKTQMAVFDASTMSSTPVATVELPQRVPYGFHCLHVPQKQLETQKMNGLL